MDNKHLLIASKPIVDLYLVKKLEYGLSVVCAPGLEIL